MAAGADKIAGELAKVVRGDVFADVLHRVAYSRDASIYSIVPLCVVAPREVGDVVAAVYAEDCPLRGQWGACGM